MVGISRPEAVVRVTIADSLFDDNAASSGGAITALLGFDLNVERTEFRGNGAYFFGGVAFGGAAKLETDGSASFTGCNFTEGWGFHGGGGERVKRSVFPVGQKHECPTVDDDLDPLTCRWDMLCSESTSRSYPAVGRCCVRDPAVRRCAGDLLYSRF